MEVEAVLSMEENMKVSNLVYLTGKEKMRN